MNSDRKEPQLTGIRPDQDEIARHQRQKNRSTPTRPSTVATGGPAVIVRSSKAAGYALFLAVVGVCLAGFSFWQLTMAQRSLLDASDRLANLESKLELSDDESTASTTAMQAKLKWAESEIRKLWGVSYDTNRKAIAANKASVAELKEASSGLDAKVTSALEGAKTELKLVNELIEGQQASVAKIQSASEEQVATVKSLTEKLAKLERAEKEFQQRIKTNEEAISAIDTFRRNVNQQLLQIRGEGG